MSETKYTSKETIPGKWKKNKQQQLQKTKNNETAMPMLGKLIHIKKIKGKLANIAQ